MQVIAQKVGGVSGLEWCTHQLQIRVALGLPVEIKVVCSSSGRDYTRYEIFDQHGDAVGNRDLRYATHALNGKLVDDLNVLLEEFGKSLSYRDFAAIAEQAVGTCESRYGRSVEGGDVVIMIH